MEFDLEEGLEILRQTPATLQSLLGNLTEAWTGAVEGPGEWSPREVVAHLIAGERIDWIPRTRIMLGEDGSKAFEPFDRESFRTTGEGKSLAALLEEFAALRAENVEILIGLNLTKERLNLSGIHPEFGEVTLKQMLATWVAHDLNHVHQIVRTMAYQYYQSVGPWKKYLSVMRIFDARES